MLLRCFVGSDNTAHRIKKAYIGDQNGKAQIMYNPVIEGSTLPVKQSNSLSFSTYTSKKGVAIGNYILIGGGFNSSNGNKSGYVEYVDNNLVKGIATSLSANRAVAATASVGNYALFAGGRYGNVSSNWYTTVDTYNKNLVKGTAEDLSNKRKYETYSATIGSYAIFAGGQGANDAGVTVNYAESYSSSLVHSNRTSLNTARTYIGTASVGNYALFAGGTTITSYSDSGTDKLIVDTYSSSLTHSTTTSLSSANRSLKGGSIGNYALFARGNGASNTVDVYTSSLTHSTTTLSSSRTVYGATTVGGYLIFASTTKIAEAFNNTLGSSVLESLTSSASFTTAGNIGNYAIFLGHGSDASCEIYRAELYYS